MAATLRITCKHTAPAGAAWEWLSENIAKPTRHPVAVIDGEEHRLSWDEPTEVSMTSGEPHYLHVYFDILGILRWGGADLDTGTVREGETVEVEYLVTLKDRYLNTAHLRRVGRE